MMREALKPLDKKAARGLSMFETVFVEYRHNCECIVFKTQTGCYEEPAILTTGELEWSLTLTTTPPGSLYNWHKSNVYNQIWRLWKQAPSRSESDAAPWDFKPLPAMDAWQPFNRMYVVEILGRLPEWREVIRVKNDAHIRNVYSFDGLQDVFAGEIIRPIAEYSYTWRMWVDMPLEKERRAAEWGN